MLQVRTLRDSAGGRQGTGDADHVCIIFECVLSHLSKHMYICICHIMSYSINVIYSISIICFLHPKRRLGANGILGQFQQRTAPGRQKRVMPTLQQGMVMLVVMMMMMMMMVMMVMMFTILEPNLRP